MNTYKIRMFDNSLWTVKAADKDYAIMYLLLATNYALQEVFNVKEVAFESL